MCDFMSELKKEWQVGDIIPLVVAPQFVPMPKWIKCSDRLPSQCEGVLIIIPEYEQKVWLGYLNGNNFYNSNGKHSLNQVTHWQPLPKPPHD